MGHSSHPILCACSFVFILRFVAFALFSLRFVLVVWSSFVPLQFFIAAVLPITAWHDDTNSTAGSLDMTSRWARPSRSSRWYKSVVRYNKSRAQSLCKEIPVPPDQWSVSQATGRILLKSLWTQVLDLKWLNLSLPVPTGYCPSIPTMNRVEPCASARLYQCY